MFISKYLSPIGEITMTSSDGECLEGLWIDGQTNYLDSLSRRGVVIEYSDKGIFNNTARWFDSYFAGGRPSIKDLKIALVGSEFRLEVWRILCSIPYGETVTYGDIARLIAERRWSEITKKSSNNKSPNNCYKDSFLNKKEAEVSIFSVNKNKYADSNKSSEIKKANELIDTTFTDKGINGQLGSIGADTLPLKISAQAVGGAVGHNPISIIIPCHRVVGKDGNLVGYGGGIELKKKLLALEGIDLTKFHDPKNAKLKLK